MDPSNYKNAGKRLKLLPVTCMMSYEIVIFQDEDINR